MIYYAAIFLIYHIITGYALNNPMIVKHEKKGRIDVYYVKKNITDAGMDKYKHQFVTPSLIDIIINDDGTCLHYLKR
jgi:hypothetical protein